MTIAVSGAAGFIGRHVLAELSARGEKIVALVRPGGKTVSPAANLEVIELDIHDPSVRAYDKIRQPDCFIHLAWGGLGNFKSSDHLSAELPAHRAFLSDLIKAGLPNLVCIGTCLEYGLQSGLIKPNGPTQPTTPYGQAKDQLRRDLETLTEVHTYRLAWGRLFYLYGQGQHPRTIRSLLEQAVADGDKVFPMSGGQQIRDYLHVTEVAKQICDLALARDYRGAFNICSGIGITIQSLVENWIAEENWSIKLDLGRYPYPDYEPMAFWGEPISDTVKANQEPTESR